MTPDQHTLKEFFIDVGHGHQLYVYEWGSPKGLPVIFLHGGPGSAIKDAHKETFDPAKHHVIFFDQRGCGRSLPYGGLEHNTTDELVEDVTKIADQVKFKQFVLYGGSWGSALALAYAEKYPKRVKSLVLYAIFTASRREADWIAKGEFRTHFPDVWDDYTKTVPRAHQKDPSAYHYKNILGKNEQLAHNSAFAVSQMEYRIMSLDDRFRPGDKATFDPAGTKLFVHYMMNDFFMADRQVLDNAHKLTMPVWIVHGRYDIDCPPITAYELHKKIPQSHLIWAISNHRSEHETSSILRTILLQLSEKA